MNFLIFLHYIKKFQIYFNNLKNIGVSDIYIDGALGFQMEKIGKAKGKIKIRVTPHMSPNAQWSSSDNENSFYIRPEDIDNYSKYVDILDFRDNSKDTEETLFNIYKRKIFHFDLNKGLILWFKKFVDNLSYSVIMSVCFFRRMRMNLNIFDIKIINKILFL